MTDPLMFDGPTHFFNEYEMNERHLFPSYNVYKKQQIYCLKQDHLEINMSFWKP